VTRAALLCLASALLLPACGGASPAVRLRATSPARPRPEDPCLHAGACVRADDWNAAFVRGGSKGFQRADAADTVPLPGGTASRVLWLFGDTLLGSGFPPLNNSIGISEHPRGPSVPPAAAEMRFFARAGTGSPASPAPADITDAALPGVRSWIAGASDLTRWLWPSSAVVVGSTLTLFHQELACTRAGVPWGACALPDMRVRRTVVSEYGSVERPPSEWQALPPHALVDDSRSPPRNPADAPLGISWGLAAAHEAPWVYVLGLRHAPEGARGVGGTELAGTPSTVHLARAHAWEVGRYATWELLGVDGAFHAGPVDDARALATVFGAEGGGDEQGPPECSLEHVTWRGESRWLVVHGQALFSDRIVVRLAESLETGELAQVAYSYGAGAADPEAVVNDGPIWATKAHAHLARIDEAKGEHWILVSYWSAVLGALRFQWFPLHRLRPWCTATGHECLG
jgi:hypothetical protein